MTCEHKNIHTNMIEPHIAKTGVTTGYIPAFSYEKREGRIETWCADCGLKIKEVTI